LLLFFWWSWRRRQELAALFIQSRLLPALTVGISQTRTKIRLGCVLGAVICVILALARPQWGFDWEATKQRGLDIIVAIDTSKSMLAEDIAPNRLTRAKLAALDLMRQAKSDRLGLVAFAGSAFLQCPLTIDETAFRQSLDAIDVNIIPQGGTALAEAIETALAAFKEGDNYKALVLLTDGEDHDSGALEAAKKAAAAEMQIFPVGIGTADGELLRVKDATGHSDYVRDEQGNVVKSHLNEELLRDIAKETAYGIYVRLQGAKTIETLYQQGLSKLPKSEHQEKLVRRYRERYHWPIALACILLVIEMLFPERKREQSQVLTSSMKLARAAVIFVLLFCPTAIFASSSGALRDYKDGKFDQALKEYEKLLQRNTNDARLHFNTGTAAYRDNKLDQAAKEFDSALSAPDLKLQELAYYNRGNALFRLGEQNPDPSKRTETWKEALKNFESSLKLNAKDGDAKFNYEFVKKKLEELKQQQQQQKQNKSDQDKNDDKNQDQQQQQQNQQNQDSQKDQNQQQQQAQQNSANQKQDGQKEQQAHQQNPQDQKQQQAKEDSQKEKEQQQGQQQQTAQPQPKEQSDQKDADAVAAGEMTPDQARQLLDAQKEDEHLLPIKPEKKSTERSRPFKDW